MNLSANFSKFREYSISISDFLRKKSCRSWRSCTLISVCCSRHFCCSMSWARISNERSTYPLRSVKINENWVLPTKIIDTPAYFSLCSYTIWIWISGPVVGHSCGSITSATTHLCPRPQHPPTCCLSHKQLWQGLRTLLGLCERMTCLSLPLPSSFWHEHNIWLGVISL